MFHHSLIGSFSFEFTFSPSTIALFKNCAFFGLKIIKVVGHHPVQFIKESTLIIRVVSGVPHILSYLAPVGFLDITLVILHTLSGSGIGDFPGVTISFKVPIHKLSACIKIETKYEKWKSLSSVLDGFGSIDF